MNEFIFGFSTGLSLILAIGAQNLFVIEQGIKKNNIFLVTSICVVGDFLLIFFGIFIFHFIKNFINDLINLLLSIGLVLFLLNFIWSKIKTFKHDIVFSQTHTQTSKSKVALQTLAFTFLNPHVYSDTVFILGNLSKISCSLWRILNNPIRVKSSCPIAVLAGEFHEIPLHLISVTSIN